MPENACALTTFDDDDILCLVGVEDRHAVDGAGFAFRATGFTTSLAPMMRATITGLAMYRRFKDAVNVPILANITEFGHTPLYTRDELGSVGVDIVLHCCSAYQIGRTSCRERV